MKKIVIISSLFQFIVTSCSNCDCSAENFERVNKYGLKKQSVEYILNTKPSAVMVNGGYQYAKYSCGENYIIVAFDYSKNVEYSLFNTKYEWMTFDEKN